MKEYPPYTLAPDPDQPEMPLRPPPDVPKEPAPPYVGIHCTVCGSCHRTKEARFRCVEGQ